MKNILSPMNPFFRFMSLVVDLIGVNLVFLLCCIPVITIGPALAALYTVTMRLVRNKLEAPVKEFRLAFRQNLKQGILLELLVAAVGALLLYNTWLTAQLVAGERTAFHIGLFALCLLCLALCIAILMYLFPLQAQFSNTVRGTVQNAFLMSIRHLPKTFCAAALPAAALWLGLLNSGTFTAAICVMFLIGFVLIAYLQSHLYVSVFDVYIKQLNEAEAQAESPEPELL